MQITKTTHPPAGATAFLAAVNAEVYNISWYYLPVVLLSSMLVLATALLLNNIQRRYPVFWLEPAIPAVAKPFPAPVLEKNANSDMQQSVRGEYAGSAASTEVEDGSQV